MLGYEESTKDGYRLWSIRRQCVIIRRDVVLKENCFSLKHTNMEDEDKPDEFFLVPLEDVPKTISNEEAEMDILPATDAGQDGQPVQAENDPNAGQKEEPAATGVEQISPRRSERLKKPTVCGCCATGEADLCPTHVCEPKTPSEAVTGSFAQEWKVAMDLEIANMSTNKVWELVKRPKKHKVIGSKWIYKIKYDKEGNIERFKARLVAQGFKKTVNLGWEDTFSPVVRRRTLRVIIAISAEHNLSVHHVDVTSALNSPLSEHLHIYMEKPEFYEDPTRRASGFVCKLKKSLYGLPNSGKDWYSCAGNILCSDLGFTQCISDPCVFFKADLIVGLYVDDLLVAGEDTAVCTFKRDLSCHVSVRDPGEGTNILAFQIERTEDAVMLSQIPYARKILEEYRMDQCKPCSTPMAKDDQSETEKFDSTLYHSAVGSLLYLSNNTRPDLTFAVSKVSQFNQNPKTSNWQQVKHIFRYLRGTIDLKLPCRRTGKPIQVYCDADWVNGSDRRSISGYRILLAGAPVIWQTRKQTSLARSTVEAEYMTMAEVVSELKWLRNFLSEIGQSKFLPSPCSIFADNTGAITLSESFLLTDRTKHIELQYHICKDQVSKGLVKFQHVPSAENLADIFTKVLNGPKTSQIVSNLGLK